MRTSSTEKKKTKQNNCDNGNVFDFQLELRSREHLSMNMFIRQSLACATSFKRLYLGCFRGDLDRILQRNCGIMEN